MTATEFCDLMGANKSDRFVVERVFRKKDISLEQWADEVKNDFRSIDVKRIDGLKANVEKTSNKEKSKA